MTTTTTIDTYRSRLAGAAERAGPERSTTAAILAGELRAAHGRASDERDRAAAALHYHHGWTVTRLCTEIHGRPNKVAAVRKAVEEAGRPRRTSAARAEEAFRAAQSEVQELWTLYKEAKALADQPGTAAEPEVTVDLPNDPAERITQAAEQLATLGASYSDVVERRNRAAAALVVHAGWAKRQAAGIAGAAVRDIYRHEKTAPAEEADPELVARLAAEARQLGALRSALTRARDEAIRVLAETVGPAEIARLARITDERVVQIRDAR
ncbi:hypothetical protein ACQSSU_20555 [Micromonospora echinospora]